MKLANAIKRLADGNGHLKMLALASTGPADNTAHSSKRLTLAVGNATRRN